MSISLLGLALTGVGVGDGGAATWLADCGGALDTALGLLAVEV